MGSRILIPIDFEAPSLFALDAGYALAERFSAEVHVLHVARLPPYVEPALPVQLGAHLSPVQLETVARQVTEAALERVVERRPPPAGVAVATEVVIGEPLEAVAQCAQTFDLVVVGTHGRTGVGRMLLGSVAERAVRHVDRPVLTARSGLREVRRILVPIDFSDSSRAAYLHAARWAKAFGAQLCLLHVIPSVPALELVELTVLAGDGPPVGLDEYARLRVYEDLARFMDGALAAEGEQTQGRLDAIVEVRTGDPAQEIIDLAAGLRTDLIVMGTHGHTGWAWVGVGSVAERVVRSAPCSVLTTRWAETFTTGAYPRSAPFLVDGPTSAAHG